MNNLTEDYKKAREDFIELIDKFPQEKRLEKLFGEWSLREVLIHMAGWDNCISDNLVDLKQGREPAFYGKVDDHNKKFVESGKDWSWERTYAEFIKGGERVIKEYESLPLDLWETKFWKTKKSTPKSFLKIVTGHYTEEHYPEVSKFI